ncbi:MAG: hypothetical protein IJ132_05615 [Firmicutes bacterium]|nr:hypothetical protein [Bacillota bacterium]
MVKRENGRSRLATILLSFVLLFGASFLTSHLDVTQVYAATEVSSWEQLKTAVGNGDTEIEIKSNFSYDGTSIEITEDAKITITGTDKMIYSTADPRDGKYNPMFVVKDRAALTIANGVTLSGKIGDNGTQCPDRTSETPTYTEDKFSGGYADGAKTYTPKGFFIDVEAGGTATLNGTISDFITSGNKETTPRYVAPVVANGSGATFNLGASGKIKNNVVGYIVNEDKAYTNAQEIKQYVKGAAPNSLRKPSAYDQKQDRDKYERVREKDAGIDGGSPGSGITATAGAVIYKDGAKGNIEGTIDNNRGDTGGVMASGENTEVHIKGNTVISRNVGVQFGGGSTTEQGAVLAMHSGSMKQNVAWFGGGAVFATQNGVDWLLGYMVDDTGKPDFDARNDGKFAMAGGELTENTAFTRGGAILVDSNGVAVKAGKLTNNMSWMLGGAVYVMGDHPKYTYTMHIDPVYVHDNLAVSGKDEARGYAATDTYSKEQLDDKNALLQRKLTKVGNSCADPGNGDLFDGTIGDNTDDSVDGKGNDGTGGGVWLCPYGSVIFDAARTDAVVIDSNYATGTVGGGNADSNYNSNKSTSSRSGISAGSDLHTDKG